MNKPAFNLEESIEDWLKSLRKHKGFEDGYIEELSTHIREDIEHKIEQGATEEEAFNAACSQMGEIDVVGKEHYKNSKRSNSNFFVDAFANLPILPNYFKVALRNLYRQKTYSLLNIFGLTLGIAVSMLILLFVLHENSFDRFHENSDRIYQLLRTSQPDEGVDPVYYTSLPPALGPAMLEEFPEIENYTRITNYPRISVNKLAGADSTQGFVEKEIRIAEPSFFEIFNFQLEKGNPKTALSAPLQIVLTEKMVSKYFGDEDAMGKTLSLDNKLTVTITGIIENPPSNSSITFDFLLSLSSWPQYSQFNDLHSWNAFAYHTFVLLKPNASIDRVVEALPGFVRGRSGLAQRREIDVNKAEALPDTYLYSRVSTNLLGPQGNPQYLYIFSIVALLILLVASLNYMNLSTARSLNRAKEVGVRKATGASRSQIAFQFFSEAILLIFISLPLALVLVYFIIPVFTNLLQYDLNLYALSANDIAFYLLILLTALGFISGSYPALILSRFNPINALKGSIQSSGDSQGSILRKGLIVFQFFVSISLIVGAFVIQRQLQFIQSTTFTLEQEKVINLNLFRFPQGDIPALKARLRALSSVKEASLSFHIPYQKTSSTGPQASDLQTYYVDEDFVETFNLKIIEGRDFSAETRSSDAETSVLVNEAVVKQYGLENAIGSQFTLGKKEYTIVGVVEDFHFESIYNEIRPLVFQFKPRLNIAYVSLRMYPLNNTQEVLSEIQSTWSTFTNRAMEYTFMDDSFDKLYKAEDRLARVFKYFTILAILIACMGVFGLSGYIAEKRTKELGIRKVLGATTANLISLLSKDFAILTSISLILALPVSYLGINRWLQNYAYRADISTLYIIMLSILPLFIAVLIAIMQSYKAARINASESLRNE